MERRAAAVERKPRIAGRTRGAHLSSGAKVRPISGGRKFKAQGRRSGKFVRREVEPKIRGPAAEDGGNLRGAGVGGVTRYHRTAIRTSTLAENIRGRSSVQNIDGHQGMQSYKEARVCNVIGNFDDNNYSIQTINLVKICHQFLL